MPLPLLVWLSPAFPVGAFAYSHGLEWAAEAGDLTGAETLSGWLTALLDLGAPRNDAILMAEAHRAAAEGDGSRLAAVAELALALAGSRERRLEAVTQGNAFLATLEKVSPCEAFKTVRATWDGDIAYPVAVGAATGGHGLPLEPALDAFVLAVVGNLVSAAVRLSIVGQTDGQRVIAGLLPEVTKVAKAAAAATLDDIRGAAFRSDLASLRHETQYTRLFRS
ncbi:urease accessory protein UreF [Chelatococcus sp. GCM10030263]|uniref:urease accessory protein UreF n=1 Tax=Chelatococcus sp. GCM10030263 TaxID=3273387 RepID=UPI003606377D